MATAYPFTNLLDSIHDSIEERYQFLANKFGTVFLYEVSAVDSYKWTDRLPFVGDVREG